MAYSLKNHEDRIAELESKIASSGGIVESSLTNPGYVKFSNGLIVNWGYGIGGETFSFKKVFTNVNSIIPLATRCDGTGYEQSAILGRITTTSLFVDCRGNGNNFFAAKISVLAIGY